jgi:hypothetical protein
MENYILEQYAILNVALCKIRIFSVAKICTSAMHRSVNITPT